MDKSVEKCELSVTEGIADVSAEDQDALENTLVVRVYCKHGIIKTHRLVLMEASSLLAPGIPDTPNESHLVIGPKALKDMIDQIPSTKGPKSDPQLMWTFGETEVRVRSLDGTTDSRGSLPLSTELTISADEFDEYLVFNTPSSIAFHLRELNATVAYAESMSLSLDLRFTEPAAPLYIDVESDSIESLCVISTSQVPGAPTATQTPSARARQQEPNGSGRASERRRPQKVVERIDAPAPARRTDSRQPIPSTSSIHNRSYSPGPALSALLRDDGTEPLFFPSTQVSVTERSELEYSSMRDPVPMDTEYFNGNLEDGVENRDDVTWPSSARQGSDANVDSNDWRGRSMSVVDEIGPTQNTLPQSADQSFKPLFDD